MQSLAQAEQKALAQAKPQTVVSMQEVAFAKAVAVRRVILGILLAYAFFRVMKAIWYGSAPPERPLSVRRDPSGVITPERPDLSLERRTGPSTGSSASLADIYDGFNRAIEAATVPEIKLGDSIPGATGFDAQNVRDAIEQLEEMSNAPKDLDLSEVSTDAFFEEVDQEGDGEVPDFVDSDDIEIEEVPDTDESFDKYLRHMVLETVQSYDKNVEAHNKLVEKERAYRERALGRPVVGSVTNGMNNAVSGLARSDRKIRGYARVSTTGTPCPFCAMLISRGPIYERAQSASAVGVSGSNSSANAKKRAGERYHEYCQCRAVMVVSWSEYLADPQFELNRRLNVLWQEKMKNKWQQFDDFQELKKYWQKVMDNDPLTVRARDRIAQNKETIAA